VSVTVLLSHLLPSSGHEVIQDGLFFFPAVDFPSAHPSDGLIPLDDNLRWRVVLRDQIHSPPYIGRCLGALGLKVLISPVCLASLFSWVRSRPFDPIALGPLFSCLRPLLFRFDSVEQASTDFVSVYEEIFRFPGFPSLTYLFFFPSTFAAYISFWCGRLSL